MKPTRFRAACILLSLTLIPFARAADVPSSLYDVPRLEGIRIDGDGEDWGDQGFRVEMMTDENGNYLPASDLDAGFRLVQRPRAEEEDAGRDAEDE